MNCAVPARRLSWILRLNAVAEAVPIRFRAAIAPIFRTLAIEKRLQSGVGWPIYELHLIIIRNKIDPDQFRVA